jgi:hypothetical protein
MFLISILDNWINTQNYIDAEYQASIYLIL